MTNPYQCVTINDLAPIVFQAGSDQTIDWYIYDETSSCPIDLTFATCEWYMCPYGDPSTISASKTGSYIASSGSNLFRVYLYEDDTNGLAGVYHHYPKITDYNGSVFKPSRGIITIIDNRF